MTEIDLNCDMGESYGHFVIGQDEEIMPFVSSINVACGFHGGDPRIIHHTIRLAQKYGVAIGAHPSYPDLAGFGRRDMPLDAQEVYDIVLYQIGAVAAFTKAGGTKLHHVKPHGALYNRAAVDAEIAAAIVHAIFYFDPTLILYGPPASQLLLAAVQTGLPFCSEAFADRSYNASGQLTSRQHPNALITNENIALEQVLQIIQHKTVQTTDGMVIPMEAQTICVHGDGKHALQIISRLRSALTEKGFLVAAPKSGDERSA
jgi:5-oxoprolinase (ATP-hydrolysing) subunit A